MRVYKVKRNYEKVDWDEYDEVVVKARNEENAKKIASEFAYGFGEHDVIVTEIHLDDKEEMILGSFRAG